MAPFDEMHGFRSAEAPEPAAVRAVYRRVAEWLHKAPPGLLDARRRQAELFFRRIGITFAVYGEADTEAGERLIPFDIIPRILSRAEWTTLERGLIQRVGALNAFLHDVYDSCEILKAGVVPADLILRNPQYRLEMIGHPPPHDIYVHVAGIDLVRTADDGFFVLEDNARTPSGVSYMLENREVMMRLFPDMFVQHRIAPVELYPDMLLATLRSVAPRGVANPTIVVLTPGPFNSAYYEHSFLADKIGVELVEASDLFVRDACVYMRTTEGPRRVDVIYRRTDDDFLDPLVFRPDSTIGVPGLIGAYSRGNVSIANAIGTGVADDKAVYSYMPEIVRFYTGEEPILNNVPTWRCREKEGLDYTLAHLEDLVVKTVDGSGGYGMLIGPAASRAELETFRQKIKAQPAGYIAQPTLALSTCPTLVDEGIAPRHVDLRPFVLTGANGPQVTAGGLTRVALTPGSLVVNSSQGGGTKDTWVLDD